MQIDSKKNITNAISEELKLDESDDNPNEPNESYEDEDCIRIFFFNFHRFNSLWLKDSIHY